MLLLIVGLTHSSGTCQEAFASWAIRNPSKLGETQLFGLEKEN